VADFYATFDGNSSYRAHATIVQSSQDQAGNYSTVSGQEFVEKLAGSGYATSATGNYGGISGDITIPADGWAPYDFSQYAQKLIGSGSRNVNHDPDGTKTASGAFGASDAHGGNFGFASGSWALGLTPIPRGGWLMDSNGVPRRAVAYVNDAAGVPRPALPYVNDASGVPRLATL